MPDEDFIGFVAAFLSLGVVVSATLIAFVIWQVGAIG